MTSTNIKSTDPTAVNKLPNVVQIVLIIVVVGFLIYDIFFNKKISKLFWIPYGIVALIFLITIVKPIHSCPDNMHMVDGDKKCCPKGSHFDGHKCVPHS